MRRPTAGTSCRTIGGDGLLSLVWSDRGFGQRAPEVCYDRENEAGALLRPGDFDWSDIFRKRGVRWFHSGGIFAALSRTTAPPIIQGMRAAKAAGTISSYDLNYRPKLWKAKGAEGRAVQVNREIVANVDVLFANEASRTCAVGCAACRV